jgi:hypothetical protein
VKKPHIPNLPPEYDEVDIRAIQSLATGTASEGQQKRAFEWILYNACGINNINYYPSDRDTAFALGREFVGHQIVKMLKLTIKGK